MKVVRSLDGGASFSKALATVGPGAYGDVATANGGLHVVWVGFDAAPSSKLGAAEVHIYYAASENKGVSWSPPVVVSAPDEPIPFYFSNAQVAKRQDKDLLHVVYPHGKNDLAWDLTLATSADQGKTWSRIQINDDAHCANHMTPALELDTKTGELHVMWKENRSGVGHLMYARCDAGGAKCGPSERISDNAFGSYVLTRQSPEWLGEYDALLLDPTTRLLHAVWGQTVNENGHFRTRMFHAAAQLP